MYEGAKHPLDDGTNKTKVFADSDYAADESRRSTMGGIVLQNGGPISWFSILGKTVALSTCEAEINAAVTAAKRMRSIYVVYYKTLILLVMTDLFKLRKTILLLLLRQLLEFVP